VKENSFLPLNSKFSENWQFKIIEENPEAEGKSSKLVTLLSNLKESSAIENDIFGKKFEHNEVASEDFDASVILPKESVAISVIIGNAF
jgi:hypothetical protein